jgi:hypothetical protein
MLACYTQVLDLKLDSLKLEPLSNMPVLRDLVVDIQPFFDNFLMKIPPEKNAEIRNSVRRLAISFFHLGAALQDNFSEQALNEALSAVDETSKKLEEINQKIKSEKA